ncbi:hypothetical protein [Glaciecola petra]|uniref:Uncharacterized protein n=1 Tax=Glaciecola petra TaxID=3075602 RepID=A0ABU2ZUN2_9ALTE|nr:hypothetical protein [Aestuariibacter sp. P117]MDT0596352.1 hypothetical protein [Aestuariibacter sp. P117]
MNTLPHLKYLMKPIICTATVALLLGCGDATEEQDAPLVPVDNRVTITGLAMNGYVANALVWVDLRQNGTPDGFEPFAFTDNEGYISYNPNTGINYCASNEQSEQRYCLQTGTQTGEVTLKAAKGIELLSGEAFRSVLSANIMLENAQANLSALEALGARPIGNASAWQADIDDAMIKLSPLSSLNSYLPAGSDLVSVLLGAGFDIQADMPVNEVLSIDYIAGIKEESLNRAVSADLFAASVMISRIVDTLSVNLDKATEFLDMGQDGLPISTADSAYKGLAESLASGSSTSADRQASSGKTHSVVANLNAEQALTSAVANLLNILGQSDFLSSAVQSRISMVSENSELSDLLASIGDTALNHFNDIQNDSDLSTDLLTLNQTVTLPTLTEAIAFASTQNALGINRLATFMADPDNRITEILAQATQDFVDERDDETVLTLSFDLNSLTQDLLVLAEQNEEALASEENQVTLTQLAEVETADDSSFWTGNLLSLSGFQDGNEQGQAVMFFDGEESDSAGQLIMCIAYQNESNPSDNISGKRFDGSWSIIGGASQNRLSLVAEGFTIQMKVLGETLGSDIPSDQQIPSLPRIPNEMYGKFGFTLNEDTATWHSDDASVNQSYGLLSADTVPQSDEDCRAILELRIQ